jgi:hypothetical protein
MGSASIRGFIGERPPVRRSDSGAGNFTGGIYRGGVARASGRQTAPLRGIGPKSAKKQAGRERSPAARPQWSNNALSVSIAARAQKFEKF